WWWQASLATADCHPALDDMLAALRGPVLQQLANTEASWAEPGDELALALNRFWFHVARWYPEVGAGDKLKTRLEQTVTQLAKARDSAEFIGALNNFNDDGDKDLERAQRLAARLEASELGHIRTAAARYRIDSLFNQHVAGRPLTEEVATFVTQSLLPSLQFMLINTPDDNDSMDFWTRMLRLIVWSLAPDKSAEDTQSFFNKGPVLMRQLEESVPPPNCDSELYQQFVGVLSGQVITLLKSQALDYVTLPERSIDETAVLAEQVQGSASEQDWQAGDWLVFEADDGLQLRCQCLLQVPGTDQLLFVNRAGRKVLQKSRKQMQICRQTGIARALGDTPAFLSGQLQACERLARWHAFLLKDARAAEEALQKEQEDARARLLARQQEKRARDMARAKAEAEIAKLAEEQAQKQKLAAEQARLDAEREHQQQAEAQVDSLTLGTWVDMPDAAGARVRAKLAVSMRSTGRYIFVDRVGSKVAEYKREQLIALLTAGHIAIQAPERGFESRLETIVRGLRKAE
ncbi:MAG TPA: DUF1631 family protein, partial [Cellvibrionaceae bacterium]